MTPTLSHMGGEGEETPVRGRGARAVGEYPSEKSGVGFTMADTVRCPGRLDHVGT